MASFSDHFSAKAAAYAVHRPTYPAGFIADLAALAPAHDIAWDCATGNGQAANILARHFETVIATDASTAQIDNARGPRNVRFAVGREDESGAEQASVDLVTVATALHWLDLDRFYSEVRRVAKPRGIVAAWCYGFARIALDIDRATDWFAEERVGRYWPPERVHVDNGYRDLPFPFAEVSMGAQEMTAALEREQYLGYISTWSSVTNANRIEGGDVLAELRAVLSPLWNDDERKQVSWPMHVRAGRVHE